MRVIPTERWQQRTLIVPGQGALHRPASGVLQVRDAQGRWLLSQGYATRADERPDSTSATAKSAADSEEVPPAAAPSVSAANDSTTPDDEESAATSESEIPPLEVWQQEALNFLNQAGAQTMRDRIAEIGLQVAEELERSQPLSWEQVVKILNSPQMSALQAAFNPEDELVPENAALELWQQEALSFLNDLDNDKAAIAAKVNGIGPKTALELTGQRPLSWDVVTATLNKPQLSALKQVFQAIET